jgi:phosphatidylinositol alpha-1,6-mannosyltransferase
MQKPKVLHCARCLPEGWMGLCLKLLTGVPYVCYVHGEEMNYAAGSRELSWMMRRVLRHVDFVIANSRNTQRIVQEEWGLSLERIRVLNPGVDTCRFLPAPRSVAARRKLGWGERPVILTVSRLQKRKGHDQMISALDEIRRAVPNVLYAIVGDGEERQSLDQLVVRENLHDHVRFHGELDDDSLVSCYQQCDLFVLPNRQVGQDIEGFGMVLVEAQACGKAVVAGTSGGTAETMSIPETGMVVACEKPQELAQLVGELLADGPRLTRMGVAARRWVVEHFDWAELSQRAKHLFARTDLIVEQDTVSRPSDPLTCVPARNRLPQSVD